MRVLFYDVVTKLALGNAQSVRSLGALLGAADVVTLHVPETTQTQGMIGADTLPVRKPDPRPYIAAVQDAGGEVTHSFLVGDTDTDRKTARAAGVRVALVAFGPEGAGLSRLSPEAMLDHYDDLPALAADWLGQSRRQ